jgi:murein hydrolase activator
VKLAGKFLALLALIGAGYAAAQSFDSDRTDLGRAKAESQAAEARAAKLEAAADVQSDEAKAWLGKSAAVAARIQSAEADIAAGEARIHLIDNIRNQQRTVLAEKQEPAVRLMAALQMIARRPPSIALVQPGSINDVVHLRATLDTIMPTLRARTAGLRAELERGRQLRADADKALAALNESKQKLAGQRAELASVAAQHRAAAQRLTGSAIAEQDRAIAMGERARDIDSLLTEAAAQAGVRDGLASLPGPVLRPVQPGAPRADPVELAQSTAGPSGYRLPVAGKIVTGLGEVSDAGTRSSGLTIATRPSAQVVAPADGRIAFAGPYRSFGQIVIVDHGRGWTTLITNLSALDVRVGDDVVSGSPIGRAAESRPTVTVELRSGNSPVDIARFLS